MFVPTVSTLSSSSSIYIAELVMFKTPCTYVFINLPLRKMAVPLLLFFPYIPTSIIQSPSGFSVYEMLNPL